MAAQSSLYNEERNLLRIRERERRNQEILQERHPFSDNAPLFPEPYKTSKGDELSSRIQSMLGNYEEVYEEVKELIGVKSHQNPISIPSSALPISSQLKSDKQHSFHSATSRSLGPPKSSNMSLGSRQRPCAGSDLSSNELRKSHSQSRGSLQNSTVQEQHTGAICMERNLKQTQESSSATLLSSPFSISALSPLLSSLSPPVEPLSPLHSSYQVDSKPRCGQSHEKSHHHATKSPVLNDTGNREGTATVANLVASSQTFPKYLTNSTLPPKPTAYVRPMDGPDQVPTHSPELKPLQEDYHEESYRNHVNLKPNGKDRFSKPASEPYETFTNEAHCVEEILKEMTHSWPPPLTAIHTPSTAEPSKFAFTNKESQQVPSVKAKQKQYDTPSKLLPSPEKGSSMLEDDLQLSDSENSDGEEEEVTEKPLSSSAPSSVVLSQVDSVVSAHSGSVETEGSETDSSSDTESDTGSSDSEQNTHDAQSSDWQLVNFMVKPAALAENQHNTVDHEQENWESKEHDCLSSPLHESPKTVEPHPEEVIWTSHEDIQNNPSFPISPIANETVPPRQTVGIKQPRRPVKASFQKEPKGGLTVESEPQPYRPRDQPSKERPTVKTKVKSKPNDCKEPITIVAHSSENKKHRSSHHSSSTKKCPSTQTDKNQSASSLPQCPSVPKEQSQSKANHRTNITHPAVVVREDSHRDKVLLPIGDSRLLPPIKNSHKPLTLVVKIQLSLLSRIPGSSGKINESKSKNVSSHESHSKNKEKTEKKHSHKPDKEQAKRKVDEREKKDGSLETQKKIKLDNDAKAASSHKESVKKVPKMSSETSHKEHRHQKASSPTQHKKPEKMAHKRRPNESSPSRQQSTSKSNKSSGKEPTTPKQRKVEETSSEHTHSSKVSTENNTNPFPVPSLPNGTAKPTRPQLKFEEKLHSPEHYMKEAKKLKHKADAMSDKIGKSFNYLDAAMFFIECGIAMEADVHAPKPAYTMFAETIDLIKFIMKLKNFSDSSTPTHEKAFSVLCMRCQSVLYMAMFRYKKDTALKYSRTLGEHFKSSSRTAQAPSPCVARSSGTPSPLSPTPSPASSGGSQPGSNSGGQSNSVTIPQMIHHIASSYVNITSYILYAYDIWEQADVLAKKNKDFFADLSAMVCPLALNSTMPELVHYIRQGLQWLRLESNVT
ncbi:PREDICTED: AF4/FMR2 family member 1 isoform X1 [Nanorana parkeri]|uniref:AF4/FMR2 family member 1 isoform X1 n=1 Tax=Nanorana parkeri TaxID=125878 RepID=UPI000854506F|nr:PREDICTED: AF4/FMR2 family member 1 isoform X1 [Nanorana parkeri]